MQQKIKFFVLVISMVFLLCNKNLAADNNYIKLNEEVKLKQGYMVTLDNSSITSDTTTFNRYSIEYSSDIYVRGVITYKMINSGKSSIEKERFFLEPTGGKEVTFNSFINGYIDNCYANNDGSVSITFENIDDTADNFCINSFELVSYKSVNKLISDTNGSLGDRNYAEEQTIFMQGNNIKMGISLKWGGSINYISANSKIFSNYTDMNIVNSYDNGRLIQQCYYGNQSYKGNEPYVSGANDVGGMYNPIQGGNQTTGNMHSKLVDIRLNNREKIIEVVTKPLLWQLSNDNYKNEYYDYYKGYVSDSYMTTKYQIYDTYIAVENSYIDFTDNVTKTNNDYSRSESPAVYVISDLKDFYSYDMSDGELSLGKFAGPDASARRELLNENGNIGIFSYWGGYFSTKYGITEGLGIYHPGYDAVNQYMRGFSFKNSTSTKSKDDSTNYFALIEHLKDGRINKFKKHSYDYVVTLGNVNQVKNIMHTYRIDHGYTLKVNPNGGSFANSTGITTLNPVLLPYWGNWNNIGTATRNGYEFLGFFASDGAKVYNSKGEAVDGSYWKVRKGSTGVEEEYQYIGKKDLIVYARWKPIQYTITYDLAGGSSSQNPTNYTIESNIIKLKEPSKKGYDFVGWTGSELSEVKKDVTIRKGSMGNRKYTAVWVPRTVMITFDPNGGNVEKQVCYIQNNRIIGSLPVPTRDGYTFLGWFTSKSGGQEISVNTIYNYDHSITVYAHWSEKNPPIINDVTGNVIEWTKDKVTLTVNATDVESGIASKNGYSFDDGETWQTSKSKTYTKNTNGIKIKVKDSVGNIATYHKIINMDKIDKNPPIISNITENSSEMTKDNVTLVINAIDTESGIANSNGYSFDGGKTWQTSKAKTYTQNTSGIKIMVKDNVGNVIKYDKTIKIDKIDKGTDKEQIVQSESEKNLILEKLKNILNNYKENGFLKYISIGTKKK